MPPILLGLQNSELGTLQAFKYRGMSSEPFGNPLPGTALEYIRYNGGNADQYHMPDFRIVRFRGAYYACSNQGVFKMQNDGSWSMDSLDGGLTFVSPAPTAFNATQGSNTSIRGGLYVATVGGKPRLFGWYRVDPSVSANAQRGFWLDPDTGQWVLGAVTNVPGTAYYGYILSGFGQPLSRFGLWYSFYHNGTLHILGHDDPGSPNIYTNPTSGHKTYTPGSDSWAAVTNPSGGNVERQWGRTFCVWQGRMFAIHKGSTAGVNYRASLWEFVGGTWTEVLQITVPQYDPDNAPSRNALFTDGTNLYFIMRFRYNGDGWRAYQITPAMTVTDITTAVVPPGLRTALNADTAGMLPVVDSISVPGQTTIYLRHWNSRAYGNPMTLYKWNGPSSMLSVVDSGGNVSHSLPHGLLSGLHVFSSAPEVVIENFEDTQTGLKLHFKVYGGGTGWTVKFYFGRDILGTQATLTGTATGGSAIRNGNQVENVAADGMTTYTVDFDAAAHGLSDGDSVQFFGTAA